MVVANSSLSHYFLAECSRCDHDNNDDGHHYCSIVCCGTEGRLQARLGIAEAWISVTVRIKGFIGRGGGWGHALGSLFVGGYVFLTCIYIYIYLYYCIAIEICLYVCVYIHKYTLHHVGFLSCMLSVDASVLRLSDFSPALNHRGPEGGRGRG